MRLAFRHTSGLGCSVIASWLLAACSSPSSVASDASVSGEASALDAASAQSAPPGATSLDAALDSASQSPTFDATDAYSTHEPDSGPPHPSDTGSSVGDSSLPEGWQAFAFDASAVRASDLAEGGSTTVGIVTWAMLPPGVTELTIEFGLDESYGQRASVAFTGADAHGVLLGLKPNHTYHYRLVARGASATAPDAEAGAAETGAAEAGAAHTLYVEEDARFTTGAAPSALGIGDYRIQDPEAHARGFWVASYWNGTGGNFAFILDADGEVVWSYQFVALGIARTMLSADGQSVWIISPSNSGAQLSRVSIDTLMVEDYPTLSGSHDIAAIDGQQMAYLDYSETDCNSIFLLDPSGSLSELWDSEPEVGALTPNCHGNALRYWPAADLFTYSDLAHDVFAINRAGAVVWRLSERIPGGSAAWGGRNHGHDLQGSQLLLFANQGGPEQSSAVIEYDLDTGAELWRYETEYSSTNLGDVQRLPNGNRLITYSNAKVLQEVTPDKRVVAQWSAPASPGYIGFRESLYVTR